MHQAINIPKHLLERKLPHFPNNHLCVLGKKYGLKYFGEINHQVLKKCYFDDIILFMKVIHQLAFYGVILQGNLHKYSILQSEEDSFYLWKDLVEEQVFNPDLPSHILQKVKEFGILYEKDAIGLPLLSFVRIETDFAFEKVLAANGFVFIPYDQLVENLGKETQPIADMMTGEFVDDQLTIGAEDFIKRPPMPNRLKSIGYNAWSQVLDDLKELSRRLSGDGSERIDEFCRTLNLLKDQIESSGQTDKEAVDTYLKIQLGRTVLDIPPALKDKPLSSVDFPMCPQVPIKINLMGYTKWGELPYELNELLKNITGVGPKTIRKFITRVNELFEECRSLEAEDSGIKLSLGKLQISIPKDNINDALAEIMEGGLLTAPFVDSLYTRGFRSVSDLPRSLDKLATELTNFEVFQLFDSLCQVYSPDLAFNSRLQQIVFLVLGILRNDRVNKTSRAIVILEKKFSMISENRGHSLKDVSNALGITRERVRQIITRFWHKELQKQPNLMESVVDDINRLGGLVPNSALMPEFDALSQFEQFAVGEVFAIFDLLLTDKRGFLTSFTKREYENILKELEIDLRDAERVPMDLALVERIVQDFIVKQGLYPLCQASFLQIVLTDMLLPWQDGYILKKFPKSDKILCVLKEYTQGLAIHKDFDSFFERLNELFPGQFNKNDRYIYSAIASSSKAYLWGWGVYIHRDNTNVTKDDLEEVVAWISSQFQSGVEKLSVYAPYNEFRTIMIEKGIPNEHALYSCLRYFYSEEFSMPKSPYLYPSYVEGHLQNADVLEEYIRSAGKNVAFTELKDEFTNRRGWKEYTLNQAIALSSQTIRTARGEYGLLDWYPLATPENLEPLAQYLESLLSHDVQQINIRLIFIHKQVTCNQLRIGSDIALYSLMEHAFVDRFAFPQYPHVQVKSLDVSLETSNVKQLDDYMRKINNSIFRSELRKEFIEGRAWTDKAIENALRANPDIFILKRGAPTEYVHRDVIGWNKDKQSQLEEWVQTSLERFRNGPVSYGNVLRDLFKPQYFPQLEAGIPWTDDLLKELLKGCSFIEFIGTSKAIFVPVPNNCNIYDDKGFMEFILKNEFQGNANIFQFKERLAELSFSHNGEFPRSGKVDDQELPYLISANDIIINDSRREEVR
ncbi:MAG: hsdR [Firmicutes bacterium]|nr:hsdR [Bacillota bacterium]